MFLFFSIYYTNIYSLNFKNKKLLSLKIIVDNFKSNCRYLFETIDLRIENRIGFTGRGFRTKNWSTRAFSEIKA